MAAQLASALSSMKSTSSSASMSKVSLIASTQRINVSTFESYQALHNSGRSLASLKDVATAFFFDKACCGAVPYSYDLLIALSPLAVDVLAEHCCTTVSTPYTHTICRSLPVYITMSICFATVPCQHAGVGCSAELFKKDMAHHSSVCPYEAVRGLCSLPGRITR
jgi:hypothetical protein